MQILEISIQILLLILSFYLVFFKSYVNEKGKNLATQEDIGDITQIVEQIRSDLANDTEKLKSELSLFNQNKFSIKAAERDALFELSKTYSAWLYFLMNFSFQGYDDNNFGELDNVALQYDSLRYTFALAQSQLKLFMHDSDLLNLIKDLTITTINLESSVVKHIRNYKHQYIRYNIFKDSQENNVLELQKKLHEDLDKITAEFHKERIEHFAKAHIEEVKLSRLIKHRINAIKD